jgi:hypothetical protein
MLKHVCACIDSLLPGVIHCAVQHIGIVKHCFAGYRKGGCHQMNMRREGLALQDQLDHAGHGKGVLGRSPEITSSSSIVQHINQVYYNQVLLWNIADTTQCWLVEQYRCRLGTFILFNLNAES